MENLMKKYLGDDYCNNHLKNYCRYWMRLSEGKGDDELPAEEWVKREGLEMGFKDGIISQDTVLPLIQGLEPKNGKWLTQEDEIRQALQYMISFLKNRKLLI